MEASTTAMSTSTQQETSTPTQQQEMSTQQEETSTQWETVSTQQWSETTKVVTHSRNPTTSSSIGFNCAGEPDGDYVNPANACSSTYYTCANGITYQMQCPSNLYFSQAHDECESPHSIPGC